MNRLTSQVISRNPTPYSSPQNILSTLVKTLSTNKLYVYLGETINKRSNLEYLVAERTRQLLESHIQRNIELERFAEFGRICATMLHDVASPLTAASLNLDLYDGSESNTVIQARENLQQLERYVVAARQQLKSHGKIEEFSVRTEISRLLLVMQPIANNCHVQISTKLNGDYVLSGDPVKFNQLLANLISNAIDAYENVLTDGFQKLVQIEVNATRNYLKLAVIDWGMGISPEASKYIFEPFYSTKSDSSRGTGIGLTMVKRVVEEDFGGSIRVSSSSNDGTRFEIKLRR